MFIECWHLSWQPFKRNFSLIQKMAKDFHGCRRFEIRPKTEVHFSIMKWSWKLLHHVVEYYSHPGDDQLIQIGEGALQNESKWSDLCFWYNFASFGKLAEISGNFDEFLLAAWQSFELQCILINFLQCIKCSFIWLFIIRPFLDAFRCWRFWWRNLRKIKNKNWKSRTGIDACPSSKLQIWFIKFYSTMMPIEKIGDL